jgi:hypothetical protein
VKKILIFFIIILLHSISYAKREIKFNDKLYNHERKLDYEFINLYKNTSNLIREFNTIKNKTKVYNNNAITVTTNKYLDFNSEYFDFGDMHNTLLYNEKVYVTQADSGYFYIGVSLKIVASVSTNINISIFKNNNKIAVNSLNSVSGTIYNTFSTISDGQRNDYFSIYIETDNTINVYVNNDTSNNEQLGVSLFRLE